MDDAQFEESMAAMEREIESLDIPEADKDELRALARDTRARHASIAEAGRAGREAAERLGEHLNRMKSRLEALASGMRRLEDVAADASLAAKMAQFNREARERELRGEGRDHDAD